MALCISLSLACGACRKEANELVHNHDHHHAHDDHDHHHDHDHDEHDHENHHDHNHEHHNHEGHNHEHAHIEASEPAGVITLSPEVAARFGLTTQKVESRQMSGGIAVSGTVAVSDQATSVVSAPMAGVVTLASGINVGSDVSRGTLVATVKAGELAGGNPVQVAKVELDAAKAEYDRIAALYADRLVTLSEYNAAKAAYSRAQAAYSAPAASGRATAPASGVVTSLNVRTGEAVDAGQPIATIASGSSLTLTAM
ncbi:MAG: efflux RND transporter periplasmic adaptor subunit, partial [Muribaculaceae bacterium]|nr:efflux RND transporter periplasmic adaptor subunit [Muribaculaceae bacterium]